MDRAVHYIWFVVMIGENVARAELKMQHQRQSVDLSASSPGSFVLISYRIEFVHCPCNSYHNPLCAPTTI